ncbi:MAG TPA: peptidase E [Fimbriimonadaceae bacterium]|nr:peptidase E [Fimbriimonadaceae bacterium]
MPHIVAIGGAAIEDGSPDMPLYRYLIELTGKAKPKVAYIPTACGEFPEAITNFAARMAELGVENTWLSFFFPHTADLRGYLLEQDLIYVGGGNTKSMLALWREWGVDQYVREANNNGTVLAGLSAGSICWFEQGITDSIPGPLTALPCLGLLEGSNCPHYDSESERRPSYLRMVAHGELRSGHAADDGVGLHFENGRLSQAVTSRPGGRAFHVERDGDAARETPLEAKLLS